MSPHQLVSKISERHIIRKIKNMIHILPNTRIRPWGMNYGCGRIKKGKKIWIMLLLTLQVTQTRAFPDS